jgi:hypothetical protein
MSLDQHKTLQLVKLSASSDLHNENNIDPDWLVAYVMMLYQNSGLLDCSAVALVK